MKCTVITALGKFVHIRDVREDNRYKHLHVSNNATARFSFTLSIMIYVSMYNKGYKMYK